MLLSFKADVFERVLSGDKKYEHRNIFPNEPIEAYLYVSSPIKSITGIMHLTNKIDMEVWKDKYSYDLDAVKRIELYIKQHRYAMEITDFQSTNRIPLQKLRNDIPGFVVPQMYYYIDDSQLLSYLQSNLIPIGDRIKHDFTNISSNEICKETSRR